VTRPSSLAYATGALVDATTIVLPLGFALVEGMCRNAGVGLGRLAGAPAGRHPLLVQLWGVRDGRAELRGTDQHAWSERVGAATSTLAGAGAGAALGAGLGSLMGPLGAFWGAAAGWMGGTALGQTSGGAWARRVSQETSRILGTYAELAVTIPGAHLPDGRGPFQLVWGMYTDNAISQATAGTFGYGFGKRLTEIPRDGLQAWTVRDRGATVFEATLETPDDWTRPAASPLFGEIEPWLHLPLLGRPRPGRFAFSYLDRDHAAANVEVAAAPGSITIGPGFMEGVPPGRHAAKTVVHAKNVMMHLTTAVPV